MIQSAEFVWFYKSVSKAKTDLFTLFLFSLWLIAY